MLILFLPIYLVGMFITWAIGDFTGTEMILWPLVFIKYMLKGLFRVLFTGWRD